MDEIDGISCTLIDNGMRCVIMRAADLRIEGTEAPAVLDANARMRKRLEVIRSTAGPMMNLGDVSGRFVPKMALVSPAREGGTVTTRSFIPHLCHASIDVFAAVTVATVCTLPGAPAASVATLPGGETFAIEHATSATEVLVGRVNDGGPARAGILRTARKLFDGKVYPASP